MTKREIIPYKTQASAAADLGLTKAAIGNAIRDGRMTATEMADGTVIVSIAAIEAFRLLRLERVQNPPKIKRRPKSPRSKKFQS